MAFLRRNKTEEAESVKPIFLEPGAPKPRTPEPVTETPIYEEVAEGVSDVEEASDKFFLGSLSIRGIMQALPVKADPFNKQKVIFEVPDVLQGKVCICQPPSYDPDVRDANGFRICPKCDKYDRSLVRGCLKCYIAFVSNFRHPSFCRDYPLCWNCLEDLEPEGATCVGASHITTRGCGIGSEKVPSDQSRFKTRKIEAVPVEELDDFLDTMSAPSTVDVDFDF